MYGIVEQLPRRNPTYCYFVIEICDVAPYLNVF